MFIEHCSAISELEDSALVKCCLKHFGIVTIRPINEANTSPLLQILHTHVVSFWPRNFLVGYFLQLFSEHTPTSCFKGTFRKKTLNEPFYASLLYKVNLGNLLI